MSIRIGLYDFFAYTIPGAFYLLTIGYLTYTLSIWNVNFQALKDFATAATLIAITIAYMLGILLDQFARFWQRLFTSRHAELDVLEKFRKNFPNLDIKVQPNDGGILRAYIKKTDTDTASAIEKNGATRTMLRNISLNFFILFIIFLVQTIVSSQLQLITATLGIVSLVFSFSAGKQVARYDEWYYALTYESIIASSLSPSDFVEKKKRTSTKSKNSGER